MNKKSGLTLLGLICFSAMMGYVFYRNLANDVNRMERNYTIESDVQKKNDSLKKMQQIIDSLKE